MGCVGEIVAPAWHGWCLETPLYDITGICGYTWRVCRSFAFGGFVGKPRLGQRPSVRGLRLGPGRSHTHVGTTQRVTCRVGAYAQNHVPKMQKKNAMPAANRDPNSFNEYTRRSQFSSDKHIQLSSAHSEWHRKAQRPHRERRRSHKRHMQHLGWDRHSHMAVASKICASICLYNPRRCQRRLQQLRCSWLGSLASAYYS